MAVRKINKIQIFSHENNKAEVLEKLYDRGFIEIINERASEGKETKPVRSEARNRLSRFEYELATVKHALEILKPYNDKKKSFKEKLNFEKPGFTRKKINDLKNNFNYKSVGELVSTYGQDVNSLTSMVGKINEDINFLLPWENLELITSSDRETKNTRVIFGSLGTGEYEGVAGDAKNAPKYLSLDKISENQSEVFVAAIVLKEEAKNVLEYFEKFSFKTVDLPSFDIIVSERIKRLRRELKITEARIENIKERISGEAKYYFKKLEAISDWLKWELDKERIQENFEFSDYTFSVTGWLPKNMQKDLEEELKTISKETAVIVKEVEEGDEIPIIMENSRLIKPFEFVTNIYGYPKYSEVDPTPFLAGFFIIFFGLCLTDAGYGLALGITSFLALRYLKVSEEFTKLLKVLLVGSVVTFIAGGLTGGWFGIALDDLSGKWSWIAKPLIALRQIDPVKDPITMLVISIVLGYVHLLFGNFIDIWWKARNGELKRGLIDSGVWVLFLLSIGLWIVASRDIAFSSLESTSLYALYISLALIILTQGKAENFIAKIFGGLGELYFGISGYISDILSYSRLLALGLATGIIGMVVNIVGAMANDMIPYVGWLLMIIILIGGHLLNLVISLVGAFIHSGRLQYVEFFKRFFDGGGKVFKPFVRESEYIKIVNSDDLRL